MTHHGSRRPLDPDVTSLHRVLGAEGAELGAGQPLGLVATGPDRHVELGGRSRRRDCGRRGHFVPSADGATAWNALLSHGLEW